MKLLFCPHCQDVFKLTKEFRACECGESYGSYKSDGLNATYGGNCVPLGIKNTSLVQAIHHRPLKGQGSRFEAFVIPVICPTMKKEGSQYNKELSEEMNEKKNKEIHDSMVEDFRDMSSKIHD